MRKALSIALKDLKIRIKEPSSFLILLLMPMILIFVLGSVFNTQEGSFRISLAYVDEDKDELSRVLKEEIFQKELSQMILLKEMEDAEEAKKDTLDGRYAATVLVPEEFTRSIYAGRAATISVFGNPDQTIKTHVVKNIVESYVLELQSRRNIIQLAAESLLQQKLSKPEELQTLVDKWVPELQNVKELYLLKTSRAEKTMPRAMDYYAVGMGVMYLIFAANTGARGLLEEKRTRTLERLLTAPLNRTTVVLGKLIGIALLSLLQFLVVILLTAFLYRVHWGDSVLGFILMVLSTVFCMSGLGAMLASLLRTESQVAAIGPAVALILTVLGGGMFMTYGWPFWADIISRASPNRWAQDGFLSLMQGRGLSEILLDLAVLCLFGLFFFAVAVLRLRRGENV